MGNNVVTLRNRSGKLLTCITFNSSDHVQWAYRDRVRVPANGEGIEVDGLQGGGGVKVGVVFAKEDGLLYFDLYWVAHGATLTISSFDEGSGVTPTKRSVNDGRQVVFLKSTSIRSSADHTSGVTSALSLATNAASGANQCANFGRIVVESALAAVT